MNVAVRPFYMTADIEGRRTELTGGPRSKDGTMEIKIQQRNKGEIETAFDIFSYSIEEDGKRYLVTSVKDSQRRTVAMHKTEY